MRKILTLLAALLAVVCVSSCKLDKEQNYIFSYEGYVNLADEDDAEAVMDYLKTHYINESTTSSYHGLYYDALTQAVKFFSEGAQTLDDALMFSYIKEEDDSIQLVGVMSGEKTREMVALFTWNQQTREQTQGQNN
ncbi:MAG: hypothetical protein IJV37_02570 [Bacteroidales bacterium]|nr:hypothetical protein [Bacteroidales bacterium]